MNLYIIPSFINYSAFEKYVVVLDMVLAYIGILYKIRLRFYQFLLNYPIFSKSGVALFPTILDILVIFFFFY